MAYQSKIFIIFTIILVILLGSLTPKFIYGYFESTVGGSLVATIKPKNPGPNELVSISLAGYGYELNQSQITWFKNGKLINQGYGENKYSFTNNDLGKPTAITIAVKTNTNRNIVKNLTFIPAEVDILWETNTYVPDFYQGASLPTTGSDINLTAIPQIIDKDNNLIPSDKLVFTWRLDYKNLINESGTGKNKISFTAGLSPKKHIVEVTVSYPASGVETYKKIEIPIVNPELVVYPYKPLIGVVKSEAIINKFSPTNKEESFKVEPYFFPHFEVLADSLLYNWAIDGKTTNTFGPILNTEITDNQGEIKINVSARSLFNRFLTNQKDFMIDLNNNNDLF